MAHIKVSDLIASRDIAGHNAAHDAYFGLYPDYKPLARKPFFDLRDTVPALAELSALIDLAELSPGMKVLDYGCGTGWLARSLAYLGLDATGADVSQRAIGWAREGAAADPLSAGLPLRYDVIDGVRLPYPDASFDRVTCFSAFHHVADQAGTLRELARVLIDGGRAVFSEPGPGHSATPEAQSEMRQHGVIENDIDIEEVARHAQAAGFGEPLMALFATRAARLPLQAYLRATRPGAPHPDPYGISSMIAGQWRSQRVFCLVREAAPGADSRAAAGLAGDLEVQLLARENGQSRWRARYRNTGNSTWRPSEPVLTGAVSIGIKLRRGDGSLEESRIPLGRQAVAPGARGEIEFTLHSAGCVSARFDLVAEWVIWFGDLGAGTVREVALD